LSLGKEEEESNHVITGLNALCLPMISRLAGSTPLDRNLMIVYQRCRYCRDIIPSESGISTVDASMESLRRWSPRVSRAARGVMVSPRPWPISARSESPTAITKPFGSHYDFRGCNTRPWFWSPFGHAHLYPPIAVWSHSMSYLVLDPRRMRLPIKRFSTFPPLRRCWH
jgi:hypothetical protein